MTASGTTGTMLAVAGGSGVPRGDLGGGNTIGQDITNPRLGALVGAGGVPAADPPDRRLAVGRDPRPGALGPATASGVALVSVLLIVLVAMALAYQIANRHGFAIAQSRQLLRGAEARQHALGAEQFARELLAADWADEGTRATDTLDEAWAAFGTQSPVDAEAGETAPALAATERTFASTFAVDDGRIELRIDDLSARLNLNTLVGKQGPANVARMQRLLGHLGIDPGNAHRWRDWVDADQDVDDLGAEDAAYLLRDPATRAANQPGIHPSEIRFVAALTPADYQRLRPYVALLPTAVQRVNVNTATAPVLGALAPNFPAAEAEQVVARPRQFEDVESVVAAHAPLGEAASALAVRSEYFRVRARAELGRSRAVLTSMLHRNPTTGALTLLSRSFGERFEPPVPDDADVADAADRA